MLFIIFLWSKPWALKYNTDELDAICPWIEIFLIALHLWIFHPNASEEIGRA